MPRLITFGDSYTEGHALPDWVPGSDDNWPFSNTCTITFSKHAWPNVLANKLGIGCINKGRGGSSNLEIMLRVLNFDFEPDDIVVVLWTFYTRENLFGLEFPGQLLRTADPASKYFEDYYKLHSDSDLFLRTKIYITYTKLYLQSRNLKHHFGTINDFKTFKMLDTQIKNLKIEIDDTFPGIDKALDNAHPGVQSHERYANIVYRRLINET